MPAIHGGSWLLAGEPRRVPGSTRAGLKTIRELVDGIARERTLWGNPGQVLRKVRSPRLVADVLGGANIPCPATSATTPAPDGRVWLTKPYRGAGGAHITRWRGETSPPGFYYQEWIEGKSCSALFVGKRDGLARLLGATTQLVGQSWLHASGFQYCGSIGPLRLASATVAGLRRLGNALVGAFGLRGFFGVDFILQDDQPWPVEINPRYTASAEVLERGLACPLFDHHRAAFVEGYQGDITAPLPRSEIVHGKAILFARRPLIFPATGPWLNSLGNSWPTDYPEYADIPHPLASIGQGHPIMTMFAQAASERACLDLLREKAQALDRHLFG